MKIFDRKDVFSWANAEDAKKYIGKYCYFADSLVTLKEKVNKDRKSELEEVFNPETTNDIRYIFCNKLGSSWGLCLPADKVKEVEEKK